MLTCYDKNLFIWRLSWSLLNSDENNVSEWNEPKEPDLFEQTPNRSKSDEKEDSKNEETSDATSKHDRTHENQVDHQIFEPYIGVVEEAPEWVIDNHYILTGYRIGFTKVKDVFKSLFMCHNETINVWSHLGGVILFILLMLYIVFCVGGMSITKPLDVIIDNFEKVAIDLSKSPGNMIPNLNSENIKYVDAPSKIIDIWIELWSKQVEHANPTYFEIDQNDLTKKEREELENKIYFSQTSRDELLYDTSLNYIMLIIQKFAYEDPDNSKNRDPIYKKFLELHPYLDDRIQKAIDFNEERVLPYNVIALVNLQRNLKYHFTSADVKTLILNPNTPNSIHDITRIPLYIHMASAIICLSLSTFFHLFCCWNEEANNYLSRLDYGGISFLIAGSCMPPYFYSFYWDETIVFAYVYSIMIFSICTVAFVITLIPKFDKPKFRLLRAILYISAGLSTAIPCFHLLFVHTLYIYPFKGFLWILGGALYIGGAANYGFRFPERFFPKKFDYFGHSHNIFHFWVVIAAIVHFFASMSNYNGRKVLVC
jgi:adiponectin receptor